MFPDSSHLTIIPKVSGFDIIRIPDSLHLPSQQSTASASLKVNCPDGQSGCRYSPRRLGFAEGSGEGGAVEREELLTPLSSDHAPPCISLVHLFRPDSDPSLVKRDGIM